MYIYQTTPNRLFPHIIGYLRGCLPKNYQYREIFSPRDNTLKKDKALAYYYKILIQHPAGFIPRIITDADIDRTRITEEALFEWFDHYKTFQDMHMELDFVYGTFPGKILYLNNNKKANDLSFTFIDNPINQLRNIYAYIRKESIVNNKFYLSKPETEDTEEKDIPRFQMDINNFLYFDIYLKFNTYEKWIDYFIDNNGSIPLEYWGIEYQIPPENLGRYHEFAYKNHDFYGVIDEDEYVEKSFNILKKKFIKFSHLNDEPLIKYKKPSKIIKASEYRIEELKELMKKDIEFFLEKKSIIDETPR